MANSKKVFSDKVTVDWFAGFPVKDYATSLAWYERLLGCQPAFLPNDIEAVWELAEHRYVFIKKDPDHAGNAFNLAFLSDLDSFIAQVAERGLKPTKPSQTVYAELYTMTLTEMRLGLAVRL